MAVEANQTTPSLDPSLSNSELRSQASPITPDNLPRRPVVVLLHLSGGEESAREWVERQFAGFRLEQLPKSLLKWGSKREQLKRIRAIRPDEFAVFTADIDFQSGREAILAFGAATGARRVTLGDAKGKVLRRSRWGAFFLSPLRLILELVIAYLTVVPLAWLFTASIGVYSRLRPVTATKPGENAGEAGGGLSVLYIRGSIATGGGANAAGGMATHVAGFARAAISLGHRIDFISSGTAGLPTDILKDNPRDNPPDLRNDIAAITILPPSGAFSATRATFEVSNSLLFTRRTLKTLRHKGSFDFIYQRYNRFNCTGVALSALRRIPLILEYNGSEVWVGKHWDPVGLVWLLKRFEKINHRFASLIVVVSEAERRNLMAAGVANDRILVNPNGVDPEQFRPGAGGFEIRQRLGIEDKIVIGFIGTFGPWHGAEVLAQAALRLNCRDRFHVVFVGDGDLRPATEAVFESANCLKMASFIGRVSHSQAPAYLDACDILSSPHVPSTDGTEFFGSPTKLFEYLASGKPVIASRLGQIGEIIKDGETGLLVQPGDAEELAQSIERLADDAAARQRIGANGRAMVASRFTWRRNAARVFDAFGERFVKHP